MINMARLIVGVTKARALEWGQPQGWIGYRSSRFGSQDTGTAVLLLNRAPFPLKMRDLHLC